MMKRLILVIKRRIQLFFYNRKSDYWKCKEKKSDPYMVNFDYKRLLRKECEKYDAKGE